MAGSANAPGEGLVTNLAHPGGNITGMTFIAGPEIAGKQLQLLREIAPAGSRVAVLTNPTNRSHAAFSRELKAAARSLGAAVSSLMVTRLPVAYGWREHVVAGGLLSYSADLAATFRHVATYVDKILKGANPADLPVEQATKFELVINLKTAKALGITIPKDVLLRADEVIQ
jgi:putative tryptophan/tyrosine transport system substrate-binding protein